MDTDALRSRLDAHLDALIERFYREVPFATHQRDATEIHLDYYLRHNIETILRLRLKRTIDALTIEHFTRRDPGLAKLWAQYTADEMLHDRLFARDLQALGTTHEQALRTEPLLATKLLQGYFYYGLHHEERPLASLTSSYFLEYTTTRTQPAWLDNLAARLGPQHVQGARAHVDTDLGESHCDLVWRVLSTMLVTPADEARLWIHVDAIYRLFCMYFRELHELVVEGSHERHQRTARSPAPRAPAGPLDGPG